MNIVRKLFTLLLCLMATTALAHTHLLSSEPADGVVLDNSPATLSLTFSSEVRLVKVTLADASGKNIEVDTAQASGAASEFAISLPTLTPGEFTVSWMAMGKDTHKVSGTLHFSISASH